MLREKTSVKSTRMNTKVLNSGGVTRSSAEVPVMGVERRGRVTQICQWSTVEVFTGGAIE